MVLGFPYHLFCVCRLGLYLMSWFCVLVHVCLVLWVLVFGLVGFDVYMDVCGVGV